MERTLDRFPASQQLPMTRAARPRLLPWTDPEGRPCYCFGTATGPVSRLADRIEAEQLDRASDLLDDAADLLTDDDAPASRFRSLAGSLAVSLFEVQRLAESRGDRLAVAAETDGDKGTDVEDADDEDMDDEEIGDEGADDDYEDDDCAVGADDDLLEGD